MQFLTSSLICVLTLLPTLSLAASTPPLLTTLKKPFSLRTATPERFNIATYISEVSPRFQANRNVTFLQLSRTSSKLPQFKLTNGTLTTADDLFTAFRLFGEPIDPPDFIRAIAFGNADTRKFLGVIESTYAAKRVSKTFKKGGEGSGLQLITTSGGELLIQR